VGPRWEWTRTTIVVGAKDGTPLRIVTTNLDEQPERAGEAGDGSRLSISVEGQGRRLILRARGTVDERTLKELRDMVEVASGIVGRPGLVELDLRETRFEHRRELAGLVSLRDRGIRIRQPPWTIH
jgi:hypothetical protein